MTDTLLSVALLVVILVASALITNWFARTMYNRCTTCGTLNARRRAHCRSCGNRLRVEKTEGEEGKRGND